MGKGLNNSDMSHNHSFIIAFLYFLLNFITIAFLRHATQFYYYDHIFSISYATILSILPNQRIIMYILIQY